MSIKLATKASSKTAGVVHSISETDLTSFLKHFPADTKSLFHVARSNVRTLLDFCTTDERTDDAIESYVLATYANGDTIVDFGKIKNSHLRSHKNFTYAYVPLGLIIEGEVIVQKGGKATKKLTQGDFIGLFETSDWIITQQTRQIGDWILTANAETKIVYFGMSALNGSGRGAEILRKYLVGLARTDRVPQPITTLPLLDWVASHTTQSRLSDFVIIAHTHLLPNNLPFFRHLSYLVGFGKMYVLEKPYSTVRQTYQDLVESGCEVIQVHMEPGVPYEFSVQKSLSLLWSKMLEEQPRNEIQKLLLIDDGGDLWASLPWDKLGDLRIAGVEQTQRGITRIANGHLRIPPIVSVASSGIKKQIESQFIAHAVVKKLADLGITSSGKNIGVLGMGGIGSAIVQELRQAGQHPKFYDSTQSFNADEADGASASIDSLLNDIDVLIGTTGTDALKGIALERVSGSKIFISASSADVEFASLLKLASMTSKPFSTRRIELRKDCTIDILNGGYPINFDRKKDATPDDDIVLTRCLMYIAAMQAVALIKSEKQKDAIYRVDRIAQKKVLERWIKEKVDSGRTSPIGIQDVDAIIRNTAVHEGASMSSVWVDKE